MKTVIFGVFIACFTLLLGCSKDGLTEKKTFDVFNYRQEYTDYLIHPAITKFVSEVRNLNEASIKFTENTNKENLLILKKSWKNTAISFSKTEIGNLGEIKASAIYLSIYSWGANELKIEEFITSTNIIKQGIIIGLPTNSRGLSAIEYLLFDADLETTVNSFSNLRRKGFLTALAYNLLEKSESLEEQWKNYSPSFISNTLTTGINGSINLIVNQLNVLLENVVRFKIGIPAGLENSAYINSSILQAYRSEISLELIQENIKAVKSVYYGIPEGLDDYIFSITNNETINSAVAKTFLSIETNIASLLHTTLKSAIENKNPIIIELYNQIKNLTILLKVDVASTLSLTITFTDNDGD